MDTEADLSILRAPQGRDTRLSARQLILDFLLQRKLALVGISRNGRKFGNTVLREMRAMGYEIYPIHPQAAEIDGQACLPGLSHLPEAVGGVIVVVPPTETEKVVREVATAQIPRVWMQQGAESATAIRYCEENGIKVVHGRCILMFAEPSGFHHRAHRWIMRLLGRLPQ